MKLFVKIFVKKLVASFLSVLNWSKVGRFLQSEIVNSSMQMQKTVQHNGCLLSFTTPNSLNYFRADSFSTKEPETLEWIDLIPRGSVLWDIGANVGLYSCYAAKQRNCMVFAFEPSVFNLELLARNIFINGLVDKVTIVPLPLSDELRTSSLNMSSTDWGGALSTFGQSYGHDGKELENVFEFSTIGLSMEDAAQRLQLPTPDYIKIDVDGIEHLVLKGGGKILQKVKGVLIEVNDDFKEQADGCHKSLLDAGLKLIEKRHSDMFANTDSFGGGKVWNQIWSRENNNDKTN